MRPIDRALKELDAGVQPSPELVAMALESDSTSRLTQLLLEVAEYVLLDAMNLVTVSTWENATRLLDGLAAERAEYLWIAYHARRVACETDT